MHGFQNIKRWASTFSNPKHPTSKQIQWKPSTETTRNIQCQWETEPSHLIWVIQSNFDFIKTLSRPSMPSLRLRRVFKEKSKITALIGRDIGITEMPSPRPTKWSPEEAVSDASLLKEQVGLEPSVGANMKDSCRCIRLITGFRTTNTQVRNRAP